MARKGAILMLRLPLVKQTTGTVEIVPQSRVKVER